ncbi:MAG: ribonucleotide reductase N-terminal alpha domain-containing protein, partial [Cetobacterium sp.]
MRQVINRAGIRESLDITKIREKLIRASEGLEVNMVELESHIESIYGENITTKKIQQSLINEAVSMTSFEESDWTYVAGRLLMMETEREVFHKRGFSYGELFKTVKTLTALGIYDDRLLKYSEEEVKELEAVIDISRDMMYDYAGANMFVNRYLLKHEGNVYELPQEVFMMISMLLAINEEDKVEVAKMFYCALSTKKISLATPILANLRLPNGNLSSCFITAMDDNIESIFYNVDTVAKISKNGGGVGLNISRVRA